MNVIALTKYSHGYSGFLELDDSYVFFQFSGKGCKLIQHYPKCDYTSYEHFIDVIRKFTRASFFFDQPVQIVELSKEELYRVYAESQQA